MAIYHPSHWLDESPNQIGYECKNCGACTCHGIPELAQPCSYVLMYMPPSEPVSPQARWDDVVASVVQSHWFDDQLMFEISVRTPAGELVTRASFVQKQELEIRPDMFGKVFERMIKALDEELPPF